MVFKTEKDLEKAAIPYFQNNSATFAFQIPLHNRIIDLAALNRNGDLIAVEFKLKDWKRAINQAVKNSTTFDFNYVCVPGGKYLESLKIAATEFGIGVMVYDLDDESIKIELEATRSKFMWPPNKDIVKFYLNENGLGGNQ